MNPNPMYALVIEHQRELERQAGCCTPAEHRQLIPRSGFLAGITARHHRPAGTAVCCA